MAIIEDLVGKDLTEMSTEELHDLLLGIRKNRRAPAQPVAKSVKTKKSSSMSAEEAKAFLELIGETIDE